MSLQAFIDRFRNEPGLVAKIEASPDAERGLAVGERYFAVGQTPGGGNHGSAGPLAAGTRRTREGRSRVQRGDSGQPNALKIYGFTA
jgi:hypothetical protein